MKGVVIETFGAGNVPSNRPDLMKEFKVASERGVILINVTQCLKGCVSDAYAAGKVTHSSSPNLNSFSTDWRVYLPIPKVLSRFYLH